MRIRNFIFAGFLLGGLLGMYGQELSISSGEVTLQVNKAADHTYYISYSAYGVRLNGTAELNPGVFVNVRKDLYVRYTSVEKTDGGLRAVAYAEATAPIARLEITDLYLAKGNGAFELQRKTKVLEAGSNPYHDGFYSSFGIQADHTEITDNDYFIPSVLYKGNFESAGNIPAGIPHADDRTFCYREDRVTLPVAMSRRKSDGLTVTLIHKDTKCRTTLNDHRGVEADAGYQFGGIGFIKRTDNKVTTIVTYPGNDERRDGRGKRCHPLEKDFDDHAYKVYYKIEKTTDYAEAVNRAWTLAFSLYNPAIYTEDLSAAYNGLIQTVETYYLAPGGGIKGPGFPWGVDLRDFHLNKNTYELGFVGAQPVAGYALFRAGVEQENQEYRRHGERVVSFWATESLSELGLPKSRFAALNGTWDDWAYTSIRQACNGMAGVLNAYCFARKNGINRPTWLNACMYFGDFLVDNQNDDGSFYLEYDPFKIVDGKHPAGNPNKLTTTCSLRYLIELYLATGDERYRQTALKAAEFCYKRVHEPYIYAACVIDNPQTIDSESGQQAINGFLAVYDLTRDRKWLEAAEQAALYTASWTFMYDVPVETDQTADTDWPKDRSVIGQHLIAIGHSAADLGFAWSSFVYYRLYLLTGKDMYLQIARIGAHNTKQSMNLRQELYPGQPEGLQQEAFTVCVSSNPRRTNSVMEALTWNFAAHLDPMIRFRDAFGTYDLEEVEQMPRDKVLELNERYARYQSSDYGQDASVDETGADECRVLLNDGVLNIHNISLERVEFVTMTGTVCGMEKTDPADRHYSCVLNDRIVPGSYLLKMSCKEGKNVIKKIIVQ